MNENKNWFQKLLALDPLVVRGFITTLVGLVGAFGITVTEGTSQAIIGFTLALLGLLTAIWGRPAVTPNAKVLAFQPRPIDAPQIVEAGEAAIVAGSDTAEQAAEVIKAA